MNKYITGLLALGYIEVKPTKNYRVFSHPIGTPSRGRYFVNNKTMRFSPTGRVSDSFLSSDVKRRIVLDAALASTAGVEVEK